MVIKEKVKELLNSNDGKVYLYLSKDRTNLDKVRNFANENIDFSKTSTKVVLLFPLGIGKIQGEVDGVFIDEDASTKDFVSANVTIKPNGFVQSVNSETQEIINDTST